MINTDFIQELLIKPTQEDLKTYKRMGLDEYVSPTGARYPTQPKKSRINRDFVKSLIAGEHKEVQDNKVQRALGLTFSVKKPKETAKKAKVARPRWDEFVDATARGMARVGAGGLTGAAAIKSVKPSPGPARALGLGGVFSETTYEAKKRKQVSAKLKGQAEFLWELSQNPELAAQNKDLASKALNLIGETIPYITATTAGYITAGPMGGFTVGSLVEGNSAYRTALDHKVPENKAKQIGIGVGVISGAVEAFGGRYAEQILLKATAKLKSKIAKAGAVFGIGTVVEALEEGAQEVAAITGEETYRDVDWKERATRILGSMAGGGFLGGTMRGGSMAGRAALGKIPSVKQTKEALDTAFQQEKKAKGPKLEVLEPPPAVQEPDKTDQLEGMSIEQLRKLSDSTKDAELKRLIAERLAKPLTEAKAAPKKPVAPITKPEAVEVPPEAKQKTLKEIAAEEKALKERGELTGGERIMLQQEKGILQKNLYDAKTAVKTHDRQEGSWGKGKSAVSEEVYERAKADIPGMEKRLAEINEALAKPPAKPEAAKKAAIRGLKPEDISEGIVTDRVVGLPQQDKKPRTEPESLKAAAELETTIPEKLSQEEKLPKYINKKDVIDWLHTKPSRPNIPENASKKQSFNITMLQYEWDKQFKPVTKIKYPPAEPELTSEQRIDQDIRTIEREDGSTFDVRKYDIISVVSDELQKVFGWPQSSNISEAIYFETADAKIRVAAHSVVYGEDVDYFIGIGNLPDADISISENATVDEIKAIAQKAIKQAKPPAKAEAAKVEKEIKYEEKTITEPTPSPKVEPGEARKFVPTGKLDPTNPKEALEIVRLHAQEGGGVGGIFEQKWDNEFVNLEGRKGGYVVTSVEYTSKQVDTAYRTIQKPVPSPMPDTDLFAMPGKEAQMKAIAQKMAKVKGVVRPKKKGLKPLPKPTALPKAKTKTEDHIKAVYAATSKEETRYAINGVKVEGDTIVATDGLRMFWAKGEWGKDGVYLDTASLKKGLLGKPDKKQKFPAWRDIIPDVSSRDAILVDLEAALNHVRQAASMTTEESKGITIIENKDERLGLGFAAASPEVGHAEINIEPGGRILGAVNPYFLMDAIKFHAIRGDTAFELYFKNWDRPMLTKSLDGKTSTLTMPIGVGEPSEAIKKAITEWPTKAETIKEIKYDNKEKEGLVRGEREGEEPGRPVQVEKAGPGEAPTGGILQEQVKKRGGAIGDVGVAGKTGIDTGRIKVSMEPGAKPQTAGNIIDYMSRAFGIVIRGKATHHKQSLGWFDPKATGIRLKDVKSLTTGTHEVAHHIDWTLNKRMSLKPPSKQIADELMALGRALYGSRKPPGGYKSEGWAEFIREYLTGEEAEEKAPNLNKWFTEEYLPGHKDMAKKIAKTRDMITKWRLQGAEARVDSQINKKHVKGPFSEWFKRGLLWVETSFRDEFAPIKRAMIKAGIREGELTPAEDPYQIAVARADKAGAVARQFVLEYTTDMAGNRTGKGLREILNPVAKEINSFTRWIITARARLLHKKGINPGISKTDADYVYEKYDNEIWQNTLKELTAWNHRVLDYLVEAGGLDTKAANTIKKSNPIYIPFMRAFKEGELRIGGGYGKGVAKVTKPIKKIKGSGREIIDPIESMIKQTQKIIAVAHKAEIAKAIANLAMKKGTASMIWKVPAPKQATRFEAEQLKKDIARIAYERMGLDPQEISSAMLEHWDDVLTVYSNAGQYYGKDNIVALVIDGKRQWYEVDPALYKAIEGVDQYTLPWFLSVTFGKATRMVRLGATGLNPSFGLIRNFLRDAMTFTVLSKHAKAGPISAVKGIAEDIIDTPSAKKFKAMGGKMSSQILADRRAVQHLKKHVFASTVAGKTIYTVAHPIDALRELFGVTEAGTRIGEYGPALKAAEKKYGKGSKDAAIYALNQAQDVTTNFSRHGKIAKVLNQMIPFFNAAIQGPDKIIRTFGKRPVETSLTAILALTIPAIWSWWKYKDEEWYKNMPDYERVNYLHFRIPGTDTIIRLPVPFELGHIFQSAPVAALDAWYKEDPKIVNEMFEESLKQANPFDWPATFRPIIDIMANEDFAGRPIVTKSAEYKLPEDQYGNYTTELMKVIGKTVGYSPAKLEHLVTSYSGGLYTRIARTIDLRNKEEITKSDMPVLGTLFLREPYAPRAQLNRFYEKRDLLNQKYSSGKITGKDVRLRKRYNSISKELSEQWKKIPDAKTQKDKIRIYQAMKRKLNRIRE